MNNDPIKEQTELFLDGMLKEDVINELINKNNILTENDYIKELFKIYANLLSEILPVPNKQLTDKEALRFKEAVERKDYLTSTKIITKYFISAMPPKSRTLLSSFIDSDEFLINFNELFKKAPGYKEFDLESFTNEIEKELYHKLVNNLGNELNNSLKNNEKISTINNKNISYMVTSKVNSAQTEISRNSEIAPIDVGGIGKFKAKVYVSIKTPDLIPLTPYEREIQDAIGSLIQKTQDEKPVFSINQIYKELAGLDTEASINKETKIKLIDTIDRLRKTEVFIDFYQQMEKHKKIKLEKMNDNDELKKVNFKISDFAISARKLEVETHNDIKEIGYQFHTLPPFYLYSNTINQITKIDYKLLNTTASNPSDKKRKSTKDFIVLKRVLLRHIEQMKTEKTKKGTYEKRRTYKKIFYDVLGLEEPTTKKARTLKSDITKYLEILEAQNYIKGSRPYKKGRAVVGIEIDI